MHVAELCRFLAQAHRDDVLATDDEQRRNVPTTLQRVLELDAWRHPDLVNGEMPSEMATFQMLAEVLARGDTSLYRPTEPPNTDWRNWPEGGSL